MVAKLVIKFIDCFFLLRIPLLLPVWTILLLGWICGNEEAEIGGFLAGNNGLDPSLWVSVAGFSLIVASIYVVNQIVDIENDRINRKLFLLPHGYISLPTAWALTLLCVVGGMSIGFFVIQSTSIAVLFIVSLLLGICYNLPPLQLKNRPLGGVIANALGHGVLTFLVGWYTAHAPAGWRDTSILTSGIISSLAPAFANAAVYLATTIPDASGDLSTGKRTFCVAHGEKKTAVAAAVFCFFAFIASFFMKNHSWVMAVPSALSLGLFLFFAFKTTRTAAFRAFKWPVFLLTAFVAVYHPEYGVLTLLTFFISRLYYKLRFKMNYPTLTTQ